MAEVKKIKVTKNGVVKEVMAMLEKDYVANGWRVVRENSNPYTTTFIKK